MSYGSQSGIEVINVNPPALLWEWNGVDVSQFGDGVGGPTATDLAAITGSLAAAPFAVNTTETSQNYNRLIYTHTGGTGRAWYMINDLPVLPDRYMLEGVLGGRTTGTATNTEANIVLMYQDVTHNFVLRRKGSDATIAQIRGGNGDDGINTGSFRDMGGNFWNSEYGTPFAAMLDTRDPFVGGDPGFRVTLDTNSDGTHLSANVGGSWTAFGGGTLPSTTWDAGWQTGGSMKNVGIAFEEGGAPGSNFVGALRIYGW